MKHALRVSLILVAVLGVFPIMNAVSQVSDSPEEEVRGEMQYDGPLIEEIRKLIDEIFWRARANDFTVFYENEFHTHRIRMPLDTYLGGVRFKRPRLPNSDSLVATRVDSIEVFGDTLLLAHLTSTAHLPTDTIPPRQIYTPQKLYKDEDRWIRPLTTTPTTRDEDLRLLRDYERAAEREAHLRDNEGK